MIVEEGGQNNHNGKTTAVLFRNVFLLVLLKMINFGILMALGYPNLER